MSPVLSGVTFHAAGAYTLRVTVDDNRGGVVTSDVSVTVKPLPGDPASKARIFYCRFEEYAQHWDHISGIFSKDAVRP